MFVFVPLVCFVLIYLSLYVGSDGKDIRSRWRDCFLSASIIWGVLLTAITELLSLSDSINFGWLLSLWILATLIAAFIFLILVNKIKPDFYFEIPKLSLFEILLLSSVVLIITAIGIIALLAPPNNWDSMTYHMSRVAHWIQNKSVAHYPTNIPRQLYQNPWAEFAIMNFQILSGGDRFANLIQWFSMIGSIMGISLIAKQLGASTRGQIIAAVISTTIPMGILQGSSTQNDYVVTFWLICFVYMLLRTKEMSQLAWLYSLRAGASLGLAILTKATAYVFAFPFLAWFILSRIRASEWKSAVKITAIIAAPLLFINLGHYVRNFDLYGNPLGPVREGDTRYANDSFAIALLLSNIVRNTGLHINVPNVRGFWRIISITENGIALLHKLLGVGIDDPRNTWPKTEFHIIGLSTHEDISGNPVHLILIALSAATFLILRQHRTSRVPLSYFISVVVGFIIFCSYLEWQPWHSRLHLPIFLLLAPFIALVFSRIPSKTISSLILLVLILSALPWVLCNKSRPLIGHSNIFNTPRIDQYFRNRPALKEPYLAAASFLVADECFSIGLITNGDDWEYPFWVLLQKKDSKTVHFEHVKLENPSALKSNIHTYKDFGPDAIISLRSEQSIEITAKSGVFAKEWSLGPVSVYVRL